MADAEKKSGALAAFANKGGVAALTKAQRAQALAQAVDEGTTGDGEVTYLSFSGQGANYRGWSIGRNKDTPDPENIYILDPTSIIEGWIIWKGGSVAYKTEWSVFDPASRVPGSQLPDHGPYADGDGPSLMMGVSMFDIDNPGTQIKFTTSSTSGKNALGDLLKEIAARLDAEEPEVPVIMLSDETFTAQGKKNGKPKFVVEGWTTEEEVHAFLEMGDDGDLETLLNGGYLGTPDGQAEEPEADPEPEPEPEPKTRAKRSARRPSRDAA